MEKSAFIPVSAGRLQHKYDLDTRKEHILQRSPRDQVSLSSVPPIVHEVLRSQGQPLDAKTRSFFEPRFGHIFSDVRVHADPKAAESARAVNALAYTVGRGVVFGEGQYQLSTAKGQRLLAHELAHVIQKRKSSQGAASYLLRKDHGPFKGIKSPEESVDYRVEKLVDAGLTQSKTLGPYIGKKIKSGFTVKDKIEYLPPEKYEEEYIEDERRKGIPSEEARRSAQEHPGFYDPKRGIIVVRNPTNLGVILHESIHKLSETSFEGPFGVDLYEGVTQYFTNSVLAEYNYAKGKAYRDEVAAAEALADVLGFDILARGYFLGESTNAIRALRDRIGNTNFAKFTALIHVEKVDWKKIADLLRQKPIRVIEQRPQIFRYFSDNSNYPIKPVIGTSQPGDEYEREADRIAGKVVGAYDENKSSL
jgi:hypothetical protein